MTQTDRREIVNNGSFDADLADKLNVPENIQIVGNDIFIEGYIGEDIAISRKSEDVKPNNIISGT